MNRYVGAGVHGSGLDDIAHRRFPRGTDRAGGGVVLVPVPALIFGVDVRYAIGASLVSVIATSSGAAAAYVKEGYSNIRIGMLLEIATTLGALLGAFFATRVTTQTIAIIFGLVLFYSAFQSFSKSIVTRRNFVTSIHSRQG
jgi:uncharacterized membrane protein YfcA